MVFTWFCVALRDCLLERTVMVASREEGDREVGDLLPCNYKFCQRGIPASTKQEQTLELNAWVKRMVAPVEVQEKRRSCT